MPAQQILVVEDDETFRALLVRFLESLDYPSPLVAAEASQALALVQEKGPDLVLMDIGLPGEMDGIKAALAIKALRDVPVIFITGHGDPETLRRAAAAQPVGYLIKPVGRLGLEGAIKTGLERHRLEKTLAERSAQLEALNQELRRRQHDLELQNLALRQAEKTISEEQERYRQIFETNQAVKLVVDPQNGAIVDANQAACDFYGYSHQEMTTQKKIFDINPAPPEQLRQAMASALSGQQRAFEFRHRLADGQLREVEVYTGPMQWRGRTLLHSIIHDVSQRKRAEEALRQSEEKFFSVFMLAPVMAAINGLADGTFLEVNDKFVEVSGHGREELVGRTSLEVGWLRSEDRALILEALRRQGRVTGLELTSYAKDGRPIECSYHSELVTIGGVKCLLTMAVDISQRKRAEQALRMSQQTMASLVEANPESLLLLDGQDRILALNQTAAQRLGRPADELIGREIHEVMAPEVAESRRPYLAQVRQSGQMAQFQDQRGGRHFDNRLCPILDDQGQVYQVAVFAVEITEQVKARESLAQALEGLEAKVRERTGELSEEVGQRRAAQEALEESERRLRRAVQWAPLPMMLHAEDGEVLLVNDAWSELTGYTLADIPTVGRWTDLAYGPELEWIKKAINKLYHLNHHMDAGEFRVRAKDGRQLVWHFSAAPLGMGADGRRLAISIAVDVTARRQAEEDLRLERRRLASVIAGTNIGTWEWNVQTGEMVYNQRWAEILGYTLQELEPLSVQTWRDLTHPDDLARSDQLVRQHFAGQLEFYDCECRMRHKQGHWVWVHDRGRVVEWTAEGRPLLMSGTHSDITQRKQAEEKIASMARFPSENPNPVMRFTAEGTLLYANLAASRLLEALWKEGGASGAQPGAFRQAAGQALQGGQIQAAEVLAGDKIFALSFVPLTGAGYVNVYGMEITQRKKAEESIRVLAKFPDENPNPVLRVSAQGVIVYANPACQRCLGQEVCQEGQSLPRVLAPGLEPGRRGADGAVAEFEAQVGSRIYLFAGTTISETGDTYIYGRDVTERRHLQHQRQMAGVVFENSLEGIIIADPEGKVQMVNPAYTAITGFGAGEIVGQDLNLFRSEQADPAFFQDLWEGLTNRGRWSGEYWNRRKSGEAYPEWLNVVLVKGEDDGIANFVVIFHDITEIKSKEERIKHQAYHDALTGLPNRVLFHDRLGQAIAHAEREGSRLAVVYLDLDNFKRVNDSLGHQAGDLLLKQTALRLKQCLRDTDTVSRLGGDEFTIILPEAGQPQDTMEVSGRILKALAQPFHIQGQDLFITTSMGVTFFPEDARDAEGLLKNADMAMYRAKEQGRNNIQIFTPALNAEIQNRLRLESELRQALDEDQFIVHYQPKVVVASGLVAGMEALVRWQRPGQGLAMPGSFIALAEETGLILALGEMVLKKACRQTQAWRQNKHPYLCVSVNLSPRQFEQENLVEMVEETLRETGLPSVCLELEITEGAIMKNVDKAVAKLVGLASMGVRLSLDDFGTGYSSLAYLKRFSLSALKVDQSFVRDLSVDANDAAIVQTIIAMGHALGLQVVAEGVESAEQLDFLRQNGCDEYQGYYFSRPLPGPGFLALLTGAAPPETLLQGGGS